MPPDPIRRMAIGMLVVVHALGLLGAPIAASLHLWEPGATAHQNFHILWEAFKYFTTSALALGLILGPLRHGKRWAIWLMTLGTTTLFAGVFVSHALTDGGPMIDLVAYGVFLVVSFVALGLIAVRPGDS